MQSNSSEPVTIIGGGLAGAEAAWQLVQRRRPVRLIEMRPKRKTPAHETGYLAELVCSNSLRSKEQHSAAGLLKEEMLLLNSLIISTAYETEVPAGKALAVNRQKFARAVTERLKQNPLVEIIREEVKGLPPPGDTPTIVATGPLTSAALAEDLARFTGRKHLAFYDAIAPIVYKESLNMDIVYAKSRYTEGPGDYLNCPMNREEYLAFIAELHNAEYVPLKDFEEVAYFEGCLPVEVLCGRGEDTLRFGPMKPVGLADPRTGKEPYAVVQLRMENRQGSTYNMVGFQTKLTYAEQQRIFRRIPGLEKVEFARLGSIHRNTFLTSPALIGQSLQFKSRPDLLLAGQITGVEGYIESAALGLLAGINAARIAESREVAPPPPETAMGALVQHITKSESKHFQPSNINFGLFPVWKTKVKKRERGRLRATKAIEAIRQWQQRYT